jgi:hypothetical protein
LHTQYFDAARPMRRSIVSRSSPCTAASVAPAIRMATIVAASASTARSAMTLRISGWSIRYAPKALRCCTWWMAMASPCRMLVALPSAQSSRVMLTISMMVGTPRPSSPTSQTVAPSYSISLEALAWLPSLFFSRWMNIRLRLPSGNTLGRKKQLSPPGACARTR